MERTPPAHNPSLKKAPIPTDYSSVLVHRLRIENQVLKDRIHQLQTLQCSSPIPIDSPIRNFSFIQSSDSTDLFEDRFLAKLQQIRQRSASGKKSVRIASTTKKSERSSSFSKTSISHQQQSSQSPLPSVRKIKVRQSQRHQKCHQSQPSYASNNSQAPLRNAYLEVEEAIQNPKIPGLLRTHNSESRLSKQDQILEPILVLEGSRNREQKSSELKIYRKSLSYDGNMTNNSWEITPITRVVKNKQNWQPIEMPDFRKIRLTNSIYIQEISKAENSYLSRSRNRE